jgi:hypothetical protein
LVADRLVSDVADRLAAFLTELSDDP